MTCSERIGNVEGVHGFPKVPAKAGWVLVKHPSESALQAITGITNCGGAHLETTIEAGSPGDVEPDESGRPKEGKPLSCTRLQSVRCMRTEVDFDRAK